MVHVDLAHYVELVLSFVLFVRTVFFCLLAFGRRGRGIRSGSGNGGSFGLWLFVKFWFLRLFVFFGLLP